MHVIVYLVLTWIRRMFTNSPQEKMIVEFNKKWPRSKVYIPLILNTVFLPEWSTAVFFLFSDSCSWVPCLSWTAKLPAVLQKKPSNSLVLQYLCILTLSNNDSWTTITKQTNTAVDYSGKNTVLRINFWRGPFFINSTIIFSCGLYVNIFLVQVSTK